VVKSRVLPENFLSKRVLVMLVWVIAVLLCAAEEVWYSDLEVNKTGQYLWTLKNVAWLFFRFFLLRLLIKMWKFSRNSELKQQRLKDMKKLLASMEAKKPLLAITREEKDGVLGAWNLPEVKIVNVEYLNPHSLLKYTDLVFTEASLKHLYQHFSK
jgi:hypothetical protein